MLTSTLNLYNLLVLVFDMDYARFSPHMRQYIYDNKKRFWRTLLLCCLVTALLTPAIHSHDHRHDDGQIHHNLILNLKPDVPYNPVVHSAGEWLGENLFAPGANNADFSKHDHSGNQHVHSLETLNLRTKRGAGGLETLKSLFIQTAAGSHLPLKEVSCKKHCQTAPITHPSALKFIFAATDLPPPNA